MKKLQQSLYWENEFSKLLEKEKENLKLKSKSELLRLILKKHYGLCLHDNCFEFQSEFCGIHSKKKGF